jgi:hypothetical protein
MQDRNTTKTIGMATLTTASAAILLFNLVVSSLTMHSAQASSSPILNPANGHYYQAVAASGGISWFDAKISAEGRTLGDLRGHLATITSQAEQNFIVTELPQVKAPVSPDSAYTAGYWLGGFQPTGSTEPDGGWQWIINEQFSLFDNWMPPAEPNNYGGNEDG